MFANSPAHPPYRFKVAISFPGERRPYIEQVDRALCRELGEENVFYDKRYQAELLGLDGDVRLQEIYDTQSRLVVVFLSSEYARKEWCVLEWRAIRDIIKRRRESDLIPIRFDDAKIPGVFSTAICIDARQTPPEDAARLICERLALSDRCSAHLQPGRTAKTKADLASATRPADRTFTPSRARRLAVVVAGICIGGVAIGIAWRARGGETARSNPPNPSTPTSQVIQENQTPSGGSPGGYAEHHSDKPYAATEPSTGIKTQSAGAASPKLTCHDEGTFVRIGDRLWLKDTPEGSFLEARAFRDKQNSTLKADPQWRLPTTDELNELRAFLDDGTITQKPGDRIWTCETTPTSAYAAQYKPGEPFVRQERHMTSQYRIRLVRDVR